MKSTKKFIAILLTIALVFGTFAAIIPTVSAATKADIYITHFPRATDPNQTNWGHSKMNLMNGWTIIASSIFPGIALNSYTGKKVYCIEPGVDLWSGDTLEEKGESYWDDIPDLNSVITSTNMKEIIGRILMYGYTGNVSTSWLSNNASDRDKIGNMIATQMLIWETVVGERDEDFKHKSPPSSKDAVMNMVSKNHPVRTEIMEHYNRIVESVQNHTTIPSFCETTSGKAQTVELSWDGSKYTTTLTDTNSVLSQYDFTSNTSGVTFSKSGNKLMVSSTSAPSGTVTITAERSNSKRKGLIVWTDYHFGPDGDLQDIVDYTTEINDPVAGYVKAKVGTGTLQIIKTTKYNGGAVGGFEFEIRDNDGKLIGTYTSSATGRVDVQNLNAGKYSVKEINISNDFVAPAQNPIEVEVKAGQTATVSFENIHKRGVITVKKTDANPTLGGYSLAGAVFEVKDSSGTLVETIITNSDGIAQTIILPLGTYTVKEKIAPNGFVLDTKTYTATLSGSQGTTEVVYCPDITVAEQPQVGRINLVKTNRNPNMGDYSLAGAVFEIKNSAGTLVDTITTGSDGKAQSKDLKLGTYTVTEKTAPYGYVQNTNTFSTTLNYGGQSVSVVYNTVTVQEEPQVGTITITKLDKTTGTRAQGDATLNGAVFEIYAAADIKKLDGSFIYRKDQLVDTLYCGSRNSATSKELPLGDYYYREKTPPVGYTPDTTNYPITIEYAGQTVSVNKKYGDLKNKVVEGEIALVKHTDENDEKVGNGDIQIEQPLEGAKFEVFLKSAGSYDKALTTEKDLLTTDSDGYAKTKLLPYGIYTIKEIFAPGDVKLVAPFDVFISKDGNVYRYILSDPNFRSLVKIVKKDAETGKTIPAAGTAFKVKDLATGKWVSQSFNYPTPTTIDVFETAPDGTLVMPDSLKSGYYELYEQSAPYGYTLSKELVKFTIHSTQEDTEILEVVMKNTPVKGKIMLEKQGNMLTGKTVTDTAFGEISSPVFEMVGLKGATFNVIAAEDIITPDGTLRYVQGEVVDTITTNKKGSAESKLLYLGNYTVVETTAPEGFVLDETAHAVSLVYEGQEVPVVSSQIGIGNTRQMVEINLQKLMEKPVNAPENFNAYADVMFGLFAAEDIKSVTGDTVIKADSLVALMQIDEKGKGVVSGELPFAKYYVQELQTNAYYNLNDTKYPVAAEYKGQDKVTSKVQVNNGGAALPNELKLGRISIEKTCEMLIGANTKVGKSDVLYTPVYETRFLPGVVFDVVAAQDIYDVYGRVIFKKDEVVGTVTTDENGKAETRDLHLGRYELVEKAVPTGYISDGIPIRVTLGLDGQLVENIIEKSVSIFNERQKAKITLNKRMEIPADMQDSFNPYESVQFGLYAKEDISNAAGETVIPAGALIEIFGVDSTGKGEVQADLPFGSYYVQERRTAKGYTLNDTAYDVTFDYAAEKGKIINIAVNDGEPIVNVLMRGSLKIIKTFEGKDSPIAGVPFTITGKTVVGTVVGINAVTDKNGEIMLDDLPVGKYTVKELASDLTEGYILSPAENAVVAADEIAEMTIKNKLIRGDIKVLKTDADTGEVLESAVFGLYQDGNLIEEQTTGKSGYAFFENVAYGDYEVREISAPKGYKKSDNAFKISIKENGETVELEVKNEKTPDKKVRDNPNTGDSSKIVLYVALLGVSAVGLVWMTLATRKIRRKKIK